VCKNWELVLKPLYCLLPRHFKVGVCAGICFAFRSFLQDKNINPYPLNYFSLAKVSRTLRRPLKRTIRLWHRIAYSLVSTVLINRCTQHASLCSLVSRQSYVTEYGISASNHASLNSMSPMTTKLDFVLERKSLLFYKLAKNRDKHFLTFILTVLGPSYFHHASGSTSRSTLYTYRLTRKTA
jgi:hypothetical protein